MLAASSLPFLLPGFLFLFWYLGCFFRSPVGEAFSCKRSSAAALPSRCLAAANGALGFLEPPPNLPPAWWCGQTDGGAWLCLGHLLSTEGKYSVAKEWQRLPLPPVGALFGCKLRSGCASCLGAWEPAVVWGMETTTESSRALPALRRSL